MDERTHLTGMLLAAAAGLLEDASAFAAETATATDIDQITALRRSLADAATLISAAKILAANSLGERN